MQPMGFTGTVCVYRTTYLMASLGSRHRNNSTEQMGETGRPERYAIQGHIPSDEDKLSLDFSCALRPGAPGCTQAQAVGPAVLSQRMDMARGEGWSPAPRVLGALCKEDVWVETSGGDLTSLAREPSRTWNLTWIQIGTYF